VRPLAESLPDGFWRCHLLFFHVGVAACALRPSNEKITGHSPRVLVRRKPARRDGLQSREPSINLHFTGVALSEGSSCSSDSISRSNSCSVEKHVLDVGCTAVSILQVRDNAPRNLFWFTKSLYKSL